MEKELNNNPSNNKPLYPEKLSPALRKLYEIAKKRRTVQIKIKLLDSIKEKGDKNYKTGNYGFTEAERKVLTGMKEWVKNSCLVCPHCKRPLKEAEIMKNLDKTREIVTCPYCHKETMGRELKWEWEK